MNEEKNDKNIYILTVLYSYIILFTNVDLNYHLRSLLSASKTSFSISCKMGLPVTDSLIFSIPWKVLNMLSFF